MKKVLSFVFFGYIIAVVVLSWLLLRQFYGTKRSYENEIFNRQVNAYTFTLEESYSRNKSMLEGLRGFVESSNEVTYGEWQNYMNSLDVKKNFPAIAWVAYIVILPSPQRENFIQQQKLSHNSDFNIWPIKDPSSHSYPILYIAPPQYKNLSGYDFQTHDINREALENSAKTQTIQTGVPFESGVLSKTKTKRIVFFPIKNPTSGQVNGWIGAEIDIAVMLEQTRQGLDIEGLELNVYAGDTVGLNNLVYQTNTALPGIETPTRSIERNLVFGGTNWTFVFETLASAKSGMRAPAFFIILILCLLTLSLGLFLYFYYLRRSGYVDESKFKEKEVLANTEYAFICTDKEGLITYFNSAAEKLLGYSASEMVGKLTPASFHDPDEMKQRAEELSKIMGREIKPEFEVFVCLAEKSTFDNRRWIYIRKDSTRIIVQLSVTVLRNQLGEITGYLGVAIEAAHSGV